MAAPKTFPSGYDKQCSTCLSENVDTQYERDTFQYGNKRDGIVQLTANIPVRVCQDCGLQFMDGEAEEARTDVICKHLGRMTPDEIKALRKGYGLSRKEFAEVTLLGEASLARWEIGDSTQNAAYDQFLRLLKVPANMRSLCGARGVKLEKNNTAQAYASKSELQKYGAVGEETIEEYLKEKEKTCELKQRLSSVSVPKFKKDIFKEVLVYILNKVGGKPNVGETVVYKLLYFIDFDYYEKYGEQITGAAYIKNHHGPTPTAFAEVVEEMQKAGEIGRVKSQYFQYDQKKYISARKSDLTLLNARQIKHIDDVLSRLSNMNASELSRYSHKDIPWIVAGEQEQLEYKLAFYRTEETAAGSDDERKN